MPDVIHQATFINGTPRCWEGKLQLKEIVEIPMPVTSDNWRNVTCPKCIAIRRSS